MMNLSKIKRVGFIEDFNPNKGYPEFAYKAPEVEPVFSIKETEKAEEKSIPAWKKKLIKRIKFEKRSWKKGLKSDYKPRLIASNKLN